MTGSDLTLINETFRDEQLLHVDQKKLPWYADYVNYIVSTILPLDLNFHQRNNSLHDVKSYVLDEPFLFKHYVDRILRSCIPKEEI